MNSPWTSMSFFFSVLLFFFKLREREREYTKFGIRRNSPKVTYLILRRGSTGESFFFYGLIDFRLFSILAWRKWLLRVSQIFFCLLHPEYLAFGSVSYEPCPNNWLSYYSFPLRGRSPHFRFWGPSQSFGFSLLPLGVRRPEVTKYQHLLISPLWPTFFLNGHFFEGLPLFIPTGG